MAEALAYNASVLTQHRLHHQNDRNQYRQRLEIDSVDFDFASLVLWGYALECFLKCLYLKKFIHFQKIITKPSKGYQDTTLQQDKTG